MIRESVYIRAADAEAWRAAGWSVTVLAVHHRGYAIAWRDL